MPSLSARRSTLPPAALSASLTDTSLLARRITEFAAPPPSAVTATTLALCPALMSITAPRPVAVTAAAGAVASMSFPAVSVIRVLMALATRAAPKFKSCPALSSILSPAVLAVIAKLTVRSLAAFSARVTPGTVPQVSAELTVILPTPAPAKPVLVVVMVTSVPPFKVACRAPALITTSLKPASGAKTLPVSVAPEVAAPLMMMLAGSSNQVPFMPYGARALTLMPATSSQWPEVSIKPPSPPCAPPRADALP